ncbi:hypothetical protein TNCV_4334371 [Trichonephila clavipes]|nr:hypothetical protein TNCV_4334371 [Trichonephila clavipes]
MFAALSVPARAVRRRLQQRGRSARNHYVGFPCIERDGDSDAPNDKTGCRIACNCNQFGSVRDDCEQMTGRCVCKQGIKGMKCDVCPAGTVLGADGCTDGMFLFNSYLLKIN